MGYYITNLSPNLLVKEFLKSTYCEQLAKLQAKSLILLYAASALQYECTCNTSNAYVFVT